VDAWQNEMTELLRPLEELSGPRVAAAEGVIQQLIAACSAAIATVEKQQVALVNPRVKARAEVQAALDDCHEAAEGTGGFSLFGNRYARALRNLADSIKAFADIRVTEDLANAEIQFYRRMQSWFEVRLRELQAARERIIQLAVLMESQVVLPGANPNPAAPDIHDDGEETMQTTLQASNTIRVVLPYGEDHLDKSAAEMLGFLPNDERARLELVLTRLVIEPRGGLAGACRTSADLIRHLSAPMIEQATAFLTSLLPTEDVTAIELAGPAEQPGEPAERMKGYVASAAPLAGGPPEEERTFVMVPDSDAGHTYSEVVRKVIPGATTVPVRGSGTDLLFCREQGCLRTADLFRLLEPCWEAYHQAAANVESNPHSRFDVAGWLPLVE
jgi:hypothetical protein